MPDLRLIATPPRTELLAGLRDRLGHAVPGLRLIAEGILGADATIDFVAREPSGGVVVILVGDRGEDLPLIARGLAQRAWVAARLGDWAQLAPELGLRPDADVRVLLACPAFGAEASAAIRALGPAVVSGVTFRCVQNGVGFEVLVEHPFAMEAEDEPDEPTPRPAPSKSEPPAFRTGLSDADLGLTPEEQHELE